MKKNFAAVWLVLCIFIMSVPHCVLAEEETVDEKYVKAGEVLTALEIIKDYGDANFNASGTVTKAEMCRIIANVLDVNVSASNDRTYTYFSDVPLEHWALGEINIMCNIGVASGNGLGEFQPEKELSCYEAVKMWVAAMGYDIVAKGEGGYPFGYYITAKNLGMLKNADISETDTVTGKDIVLMIYNSLDIAFMEQIYANNEINYYVDKDNYGTMLSRRNITKAKGQVLETEFSSLVPGAKPQSRGYVKIDGEIYKTGDTQISDFLGYCIDFYYEESDGEYTVKYFSAVGGTEKIVIDAENVDENATTLSSIYYYTDKEKTARKSEKIAQGAVLIYNGKAEPLTAELLNPRSGQIILVDSNTSGKASGYDIVYVNEYKHYVVSSVSKADYEIFLLNNTYNGKYSFKADVNDAQNRINIYRNGKQADFESIVSGDIIAVRGSIDGECIVIEVLDSKVTGTVKSINEDEEMLIDDTAYEISREYSSRYDMKAAPGETGTFYLDRGGKVFYADMSAAGSKNYGFFIELAGGDGIGDNYEAKIMTEDSEFIVCPFAQKVRITNMNKNNTYTEATLNVNDAFDYISSMTDDKDRFIIYSLNTAGEINGVEYAVQGNSSGSAENVFTQDVIINSSTKYAYGRFGNGKAHLYNTKIFVANKSENGTYSDVYSRVDNGYFADNRPYGSADSPVYIYDMGKSGVAGAVLVIEKSASDIASLSKNPWAMNLVEKIGKAVNDEGEIVTTLTCLSSGSKRTYTIADRCNPSSDSLCNDINDVKCGDVLIFETDIKGNIDKFNVIFRESNRKEGQIFLGGAGYYDTASTDTTVYYGKVYFLDNSYIRLYYGGGEYITFRMQNGSMYYKYSSETGKVSVAEKGMIAYSEMAELSQNSNVIVHANRNSVSTIIIYE